MNAGSSLARAPQGGQKLVHDAGGYALTAKDFNTIKDTLYADAGIVLDAGKASLVYSRLAKRLRTLGMESFHDYCALILSAEGVDERQRMLAALTTNVTRFFREPHHFEHLKTRVLPPLIARAEAGGRVRIWSAGCSSGQEPYSIALTLLSMKPGVSSLDVKILATDIDPNVIAVARAGRYAADLVSGVPADLRSRWMRRTPDGDTWDVSAEAQDLVSFRELNLIGDWPMKRGFDVVFCRNVVIYFDEATQARLWDRFTERLPTGGTLFVGHSERVTGPALARMNTDGLTTYVRKGA